MLTKKGICQKKKKFFGIITITNKGQIAIPTELQRELDIKKGDKLIIIKRRDNKGLNLLKSNTFENFIEKLSKD
ncbi:MAG: AbrB/MazE/SpoVT family DNA-binding domain-containing protein [Patescibacteria group bacterium]